MKASQKKRDSEGELRKVALSSPPGAVLHSEDSEALSGGSFRCRRAGRGEGSRCPQLCQCPQPSRQRKGDAEDAEDGAVIHTYKLG